MTEGTVVLSKVDEHGVGTSNIPLQARTFGRDPAWRARALWWWVLLSATTVGFYSMRYALPNPPWILTQIKNNFLFPHELSIHAIAGSIALLVGPWQLSASLRTAHPRVHRWLGRIYVADVLVAWLLAIFLIPTVTTGFLAASAFFIAGVLWIGFAILGVLAILRRDIQAHRRYMLRSYAMALTAVTIRYYYVPARALGIPFEYNYPASLWLAILTNIAVIEVVLRWPQMRAAFIRPPV